METAEYSLRLSKDDVLRLQYLFNYLTNMSSRTPDMQKKERQESRIRLDLRSFITATFDLLVAPVEEKAIKEVLDGSK